MWIMTESFAQAMENRGVTINREQVIIIPDYSHNWEINRGIGATSKRSRLDKVNKEIEEVVRKEKDNGYFS